ncbi:MAG: hypothetical protein RR415_11885, partial [Ruthenibacterium sp.]
PRTNYDLGFSIENVVYFELLRRGYKVNIGKYDACEVDFVAQKQGVKWLGCQDNRATLYCYKMIVEEKEYE